MGERGGAERSGKLGGWERKRTSGSNTRIMHVGNAPSPTSLSRPHFHRSLFSSSSCAASRSECITTEYNHLHASEFLALTTRRHGSVRPRDRIPPVCNTRECWSACRATMAHLSFPAHMHVAFNKRARSRQLILPLINELRTLRLMIWRMWRVEISDMPPGYRGQE